ncbi:hypothetical protein JB92DRAFT_133643 [Gautieria morchelliformis]|nr:hypothetical protein JB92DRAFT_133643 [Gautieria morchelliformis]
MSWSLRPKFVSTYEKLFQSSPFQLKALDQDEFWAEIFSLDVDAHWLSEKLHHLSQEDCLGRCKGLLNMLCRRCLAHLSSTPFNHPVKANALETLVLFVRCMLSKQLSGWEIMDVFAGGVVESDPLFSTFTKTINDIMGDEDAPVEYRHRALQLALVFMCGVNQLSPGAYLLRRDLYPSVASIILSPKTRQFTFEATLLLSLLSNFHKSDGAKTNPYLNRIKQSTDNVLMETISWVAMYAAQKAAANYQEIMDDSPPTLATSFGSFVAALRPDRALSATPVDPPRELFKNQPIEAAIVLLPVYDLLHYNSVFRDIFRRSLAPPVDSAATVRSETSYSHALLSLSSYLLTHASSTSSPRALAYAHLALTTLLVVVGDDVIMSALCQPPPPGYPEVRLCRQRAPYLPFSSSPRPQMCALLDCCVLWLRHNLHKRLEVLSYSTCTRILYRVVGHLAATGLRLHYHWEELWRSLFLVLDFAANQIGTLKSVAKVDELVQDIICLLDFATRFAERFLPTSQSLHQFVYELVRSAPVLAKQSDLLKGLKLPTSRRTSFSPRGATELANLEQIIAYYQQKLPEETTQTAKAVLSVLGQIIDQEGIHGTQDLPLEELPLRYSDDIVDYSFVRWACIDGLALMGE